jgi:hypothetical protein
MLLTCSAFVSTKPQNTIQKPATAGVENVPDWVRLVREYVSALRFGVVRITVQDGKVVLIERTDSVRFDRPE